MNSVATYKTGQVSITCGQKKKHYTQMTNAEIMKLENFIKSSDYKKMRLTNHLIKKMQRKELKFTGKDIINLFTSFEVIEYNETRGDKRVLIRGLQEESILVEGKKGTANLCFVISIDSLEIITAYWNCTSDNHFSLNMSRYSQDLVISI